MFCVNIPESIENSKTTFVTVNLSERAQSGEAVYIQKQHLLLLILQISFLFSFFYTIQKQHLLLLI